MSLSTVARVDNYDVTGVSEEQLDFLCEGRSQEN